MGPLPPTAGMLGMVVVMVVGVLLAERGVEGFTGSCSLPPRGSPVVVTSLPETCGEEGAEGPKVEAHTQVLVHGLPHLKCGRHWVPVHWDGAGSHHDGGWIPLESLHTCEPGFLDFLLTEAAHAGADVRLMENETFLALRSETRDRCQHHCSSCDKEFPLSLLQLSDPEAPLAPAEQSEAAPTTQWQLSVDLHTPMKPLLIPTADAEPPRFWYQCDPQWAKVRIGSGGNPGAYACENPVKNNLCDGGDAVSALAIGLAWKRVHLCRSATCEDCQEIGSPVALAAFLNNNNGWDTCNEIRWMAIEMLSSHHGIHLVGARVKAEGTEMHDWLTRGLIVIAETNHVLRVRRGDAVFEPLDIPCKRPHYVLVLGLEPDGTFIVEDPGTPIGEQARYDASKVDAFYLYDVPDNGDVCLFGNVFFEGQWADAIDAKYELTGRNEPPTEDPFTKGDFSSNSPFGQLSGPGGLIGAGGAFGSDSPVSQKDAGEDTPSMVPFQWDRHEKEEVADEVDADLGLPDQLMQVPHLRHFDTPLCLPGPIPEKWKRCNQKVSPASHRDMLRLWGDVFPCQREESCQCITHPCLIKFLVVEDVGPFRVQGIEPAVESLKRIFDKVKHEQPELYDALGTTGMLCCRRMPGAEVFSMHSWGTAIDITLCNKLDVFGDNRAMQGLVDLASFFAEEQWYWGGGWDREDAMHFEVSHELINDWFASRRLFCPECGNCC
eukprot:TRINITY_DN33985_c0_g1_i1.p1 TRINITY_DN33985_c0_g1~~TRINITY_DN33985_c0_g1_i1.p1  ORF type:complete len:726 (+),score=152.26 TRINITY_DN33985_c0_g1_i1:27-2180(+)